MFPQKDAIVKLLQDDDPRTVGLVKDQLAQQGRQGAAVLLDQLVKIGDFNGDHIVVVPR